MADQRPDIILLVSHRGVCLTDSLAILTGATVSGTAHFNKHWGDFAVSANLADDVARDLADVLEKRRVENCLISMDGLGETNSDGKLGWGEVREQMVCLLLSNFCARWSPCGSYQRREEHLVPGRESSLK